MWEKELKCAFQTVVPPCITHAVDEDSSTAMATAAFSAFSESQEASVSRLFLTPFVKEEVPYEV